MSLRDSYEGLARDLLGDVPSADLARCWSVLTTVQDRLGDVVARRTAATPPSRPRPHSGPGGGAPR